MNIHDLTGKTLGQYQIREELGAGGMGAVYLAYQPTLDRIVALKVLASELAIEEDYVERFNREARMAASLEHSHIVPIYDFGTEGHFSYVVMRLLSGGSLQDRLEKQQEAGQPLPTLHETSMLLGHIASALDYAHSRSIIHRDIKPTNIMFDNHGSAFVVDFGIAKLISGTSELTQTGAMLGTPYYMSPEQWRGEPLTPAVDQYALGAMIYILVTGSMPFQAETPYALMNKHLYEAPTPVTSLDSNVPEAINSILMRAMAKDARDRFDNVTDFAIAFHNAVIGTSTGSTGFFTALGATPILTPAPIVPSASPSDAPLQDSAHIQVSPPSQPVMQPTPAPPLPQQQTSNRLLFGGIAGIGAILVGIIVVLLISRDATDHNALELTRNGLTALALNAEFSPTTSMTVSETSTFTATTVSTDTPVFTITPTALVAAQVDATTEVPLPVETATPSSTLTETPVPTATFTATILPTETATNTPLTTEAPSITATAIPPTQTVLPSSTSTETASSTPLPSETPTATVTAIPPTQTVLPSVTSTETATSTPLPSETPTVTATAIPPTITPTPANLCEIADVNDNGEVDILDIRFVASLYGVTIDNESYDPTYDFDLDGTIGILEIRRVASAFRQTCPEATG